MLFYALMEPSKGVKDTTAVEPLLLGNKSTLRSVCLEIINPKSSATLSNRTKASVLTSGSCRRLITDVGKNPKPIGAPAPVSTPASAPAPLLEPADWYCFVSSPWASSDVLGGEQTSSGFVVACWSFDLLVGDSSMGVWGDGEMGI
jgi:hypothetical protein